MKKQTPIPSNSSILITGASSGIGKTCALYLDQLGFKVYAGVRHKKDQETMIRAGSERLIPIFLDVTRDSDVQKAFELISSESDTPLYGLVNNAGVSISGVIEATPVDEFRNIMEVNVLGLHRITKAFLPLLRQVAGRIVNIGSAASFLAGPGSSSYAATKFAVRAMTDAIRIELYPFGMHVALVAPGAVESAMWEKSKDYRQKLRQRVPKELKQSYEIFARAGDKIAETVKPAPAVGVARTVAHALMSANPKYTYLVGQDAKRTRILSRLPTGMYTAMVFKHISELAKA